MRDQFKMTRLLGIGFLQCLINKYFNSNFENIIKFTVSRTISWMHLLSAIIRRSQFGKRTELHTFVHYDKTTPFRRIPFQFLSLDDLKMVHTSLILRTHKTSIDELCIFCISLLISQTIQFSELDCAEFFQDRLLQNFNINIPILQ